MSPAAGPGSGVTAIESRVTSRTTQRPHLGATDLMGSMEITRRGMASGDREPQGRRPRGLRALLGDERDPDDEDFQESEPDALDQRLRVRQPAADPVKKGERVRWYVMSMGTEVDLHTPHWHGNTVTVNGMRMDTVSLLPGQHDHRRHGPGRPGIWLFHCHVNDHIARRHAHPLPGGGLGSEVTRELRRRARR